MQDKIRQYSPSPRSNAFLLSDGISPSALLGISKKETKKKKKKKKKKNLGTVKY